MSAFGIAPNHRRLSPVAHLQLGENACQVVLHRLFVEIEFQPYALVAEAFSDQAQYLALPCCQVRERIGIGLIETRRKVLRRRADNKGETSLLPAATAANTSRSSFKPTPLSTYPSTPSCSACTTSSAASETVNTTIFCSGTSRRTAAIVSKPPPGIDRSSSRMSGDLHARCAAHRRCFRPGPKQRSGRTLPRCVPRLP